MPFRQEVLNVILAELLQERGLVSAPEQILRAPSSGTTNMPDVLVDFRGLRLAIECEIASRQVAQARSDSFAKARERVENAIAHIGVAVVYPARLRSVSFATAKSQMAHSQLEYAIITEAAVTQLNGQFYLFPVAADASFVKGTVDDLGDSLRRCYDQLVRDETVERAVALLESTIERCLEAFRIQPATAVRMGDVLGIGGLTTGRTTTAVRQRNAVSRISALILVNALIFQEVLSQADPQVHPLQRMRGRADLVDVITEHWQFILDHINYYPIFSSAVDLLRCISADAAVNRAIHLLVDASLSIVNWRASLRHDLAGRIYHRILEEAKYLGAYYTALPTAALLLRLAMRSGDQSRNWSDISSLSQMRIADLACGTGTLLMAAADAVLDNYVRACAETGRKPDLIAMHRALVEKMIYGYDVLPSAVHLTASTLSLRVPETPVNVTNLYRVLHGGPEHLLGTLECLETEGAVGTLFSRSEQVGGRGSIVQRHVTVPEVRLCVMNPPFTSSRKGNRLFGSVPDRERAAMQARLKRIVRDKKLSASVTAGLGAVFVALGDSRLEEGGRLALVLPRSVTSGVSWEPTRELITGKYHLEYVVVCHEPHHWNFSENTNLSEALIVARKRRAGESPTDDSVAFVNLWRQPANSVEGLSLGRDITDGSGTDIHDADAPSHLRIAGRKVGEVVSVKQSWLEHRPWSFLGGFAQSSATKAFVHLLEGQVYVPGEGIVNRKLPTCTLGEIAALGPDPRDVYDGFSLSEDAVTEYPSLWGHDADVVTTMKASPNMHLAPLAAALPGRNLRDISLLWPRAGRIAVAMRIRLNTKRMMAVRLPKRVLSDVWWPLALRPSRGIAGREKALVLWLNSTPAMLIWLGHREDTEGAWVQFKKPVLERMPVLDVAKVGARSLRTLAAAYDRLCGKSLLLIPELAVDATRKAIDDAVSSALGLPDFSPWRELLSREPVLAGSLDRLLTSPGE